MATSFSSNTGTSTAMPLPAVASAKGSTASPPPSPDPLLLQETRNEIRTLVQEIAQLAQKEIPAEEFYAGLLGRMVSAMAAVGGAVWTSGESGIALAYQVNLAGAVLDDTPA